MTTIISISVIAGIGIGLLLGFFIMGLAAVARGNCDELSEKS